MPGHVSNRRVRHAVQVTGTNRRSSSCATAATTAGTRLAISTLALLCALGVTGCSPTNNGPLVGPRVGPDEVAICTPSYDGRQAVFGEVLGNTATADVTITRVTGQTQTPEVVEFFFDTAGPALDQLIGAWSLPEPDPGGFATDIMNRATRPQDTVIPAETSASILILVSPEPGQDPVAVGDVVIDYDADGKSYREQIRIDYTVQIDRDC